VREKKTIMSIWIRELGPDEFDVLDAVFAGLSPASRERPCRSSRRVSVLNWRLFRSEGAAA